MMQHQTIIIPGPPQAAKRPRFSRRSGRAYMPHKEAEDCMTYKITQQWDREPLKCPVFIQVEYWMGIPKSTSKKKTALMKGTPHTKKWDLDNALKILLDSMLGVVMEDDGQVYQVLASKRWHTEPSTDIIVFWDEEGDYGTTD